MARFLTARQNGDTSLMAEAHRAARGLGADAFASHVADSLRAAGSPVPRGPNSASRANPFDLTDREMEVLVEVTKGSTNPQIADVLGISPKTVGHHGSRILTKLGVRTRAEAASTATRLGGQETTGGDELAGL